jgi:hypothetical protein
MWFDEGEKGLNIFTKGMKNLATWGTELTIKAVVDLLGFKLHIL